MEIQKNWYFDFSKDEDRVKLNEFIFLMRDVMTGIEDGTLQNDVMKDIHIKIVNPTGNDYVIDKDCIDEIFRHARKLGIKYTISNKLNYEELKMKSLSIKEIKNLDIIVKRIVITIIILAAIIPVYQFYGRLRTNSDLIELLKTIINYELIGFVIFSITSFIYLVFDKIFYSYKNRL